MGDTKNRAFVQFVLEPLYKLYSTVLGESAEGINAMLRSLGVKLSREQLHMNSRPLLRLALSRLFGTAEGIVDALVHHVRSPVAAASRKVAHSYTGPSAAHGHTCGCARQARVQRRWRLASTTGGRRYRHGHTRRRCGVGPRGC